MPFAQVVQIPTNNGFCMNSALVQTLVAHDLLSSHDRKDGKKHFSQQWKIDGNES